MKEYKLAINPYVCMSFEDVEFDNDIYMYTEIENIYFITDDEDWFDFEHLVKCDPCWEWNMKLIIVKDNKCTVKTIKETGIELDKEYNIPWFQYLEKVYNRDTDDIICNKKYNYFSEQIKLNKEQ